MENQGPNLIGKYETGRLLGKGTFAKVYHARENVTGQSVAIKVFDRNKLKNANLVDQTKTEITVMRMAKHPNIVELHEVMATKTKIYFVLEYAKGGDLYEKVKKGKLPPDVARKYFQQLIAAVEYFHSKSVYHRDLKLENLLLDDDDNLKVSDFGLSALVQPSTDARLKTTCGTPAYVAPEVIDRLEYDGAKADIWSCGVILFVMLAGYLPFFDDHLMVLYSKIRRGQYKCPSLLPRYVRRLLKKMLDTNPTSRISIGDIKKNKWFIEGLSNNDLEWEATTEEQVPSHVTETFNPSISSISKDSITRLNAFDIISLSPGLDLSNLFDGSNRQNEVRFTAMAPASIIISKLERMARSLKLRVKKKEAGLVRMQGLKEGRKGALAIDAEIFEFTPSFHLIEIKKSSGDTLEYHDLLKDDIRPALKDIVWS